MHLKEEGSRDQGPSLATPRTGHDLDVSAGCRDCCGLVGIQRLADGHACPPSDERDLSGVILRIGDQRLVRIDRAPPVGVEECLLKRAFDPRQQSLPTFLNGRCLPGRLSPASVGVFLLPTLVLGAPCELCGPEHLVSCARDFGFRQASAPLRFKRLSGIRGIRQARLDAEAIEVRKHDELG